MRKLSQFGGEKRVPSGQDWGEATGACEAGELLKRTINQDSAVAAVVFVIPNGAERNEGSCFTETMQAKKIFPPLRMTKTA
jgi:hypothetical protein